MPLTMQNYTTRVAGQEFLSRENWSRWELSETTDILFFERIDDEFWYGFQSNYWWIFWVIVGAYWMGAYSLKSYMRHRPPLDNLMGIMVTYNTLVTIFSIIGLWRISTTFFPILFSGPDGIYKSLCTRFDVSAKDGFWLLAFGWSKVAHLLDTFFIILRKKPIQFMQMYHHSIVVLVPQHILPYGEPILMWWGVSNLTQHAFTYPYFAAKALKINVPKFVSTFIILLEVLQMFIGLGTGIYTLQILNQGDYCVRHPKSISIMYFVYASMTILALQMAYDHFKQRRNISRANKLKQT